MNVAWPDMTFPCINLHNAPLSPEMIALHLQMNTDEPNAGDLDMQNDGVLNLAGSTTGEHDFKGI